MSFVVLASTEDVTDSCAVSSDECVVIPFAAKVSCAVFDGTGMIRLCTVVMFQMNSRGVVCGKCNRYREDDEGYVHIFAYQSARREMEFRILSKCLYFHTE